MAKTHHHTMESRSKTKNSIKRLFFCLLAIFLQIAFFSFYCKTSEYTDAMDQCLNKNSRTDPHFIYLQQK